VKIVVKSAAQGLRVVFITTIFTTRPRRPSGWSGLPFLVAFRP
jgi:hypothetical protein